MAYEVSCERAEPRTLAAGRTATNRQRLVKDMFRLLDMVWPLVRGQGVRFGHNVVVYYPGEGGGGSFTIEAGVEVYGDFTAQGEVRLVETPSGEVATVAHYGEYSQLAPAYAALEQWCAASGRRATGVNWEVYGDPSDDLAKQRTDVYFLLEPAKA